jgi:hypothetical protein
MGSSRIEAEDLEIEYEINAKGSKNKLNRKSTSDTKILDQNGSTKEIKPMNSEANKGTDLSKDFYLNNKHSDKNRSSLEDTVVHNDLWMLKYDINERGIGKILLPPSLSTLLQSDRVSISPSAGGLFIRSI